MGRWSKWLGHLVAVAGSSLIAFAVLEVVLRFYQPIPLPVRGQRLMLAPHTAVEQASPLPGSAKLESHMVLRTNALGLRGPEPPPPASTSTRIITVGGSTTQNRFISHEKSWPGLLESKLRAQHLDVWLNNAGLDGNTTFGHQLLLDQLVLGLAPHVIVFLIGVNDVLTPVSNEFDGFTRIALRDAVIERSALLSTAQVFWRSYRAREQGLTRGQPLDLLSAERREYSPETWAAMHRSVDGLLPAYRLRVEALVERCRSRGSEPVLVTQPALWGDVDDPTLGIPLGDIDQGPFAGGTNAKMRWAALERYNDVTRAVGRERGVTVIDLAAEMPKDSALYFDWIHFSLQGSEVVASIVARGLEPVVAARQPSAVAQP